ncbi:MAG: ABC transporter permease subunit [Cytophagales bacterium]|nr:ABC transporter permease subunit [Armatimonadota bacterium]
MKNTMLPTSALLLMLMALLSGSARTARAQPGALETIRQRGTLRIATDATYPPFEYREGGRLQGFDIEIGDEIARELGVSVTWIPMEWSGVLGALETRKCDLVMSGVTITDERKKGNAFSQPYFLSGQSIARRKGDTTVKTLDDLREKTVSVQEETTGQYALLKAGIPKTRIQKFDQLQDGLLDVRNKKSDAVVADLPALKAILRKGYPELELAQDTPFVQENVGIVARKTEPDLLLAVNQAIERIFVDGRYARIYEKWLGDPVTPALIADLNRVRDVGTPVAAPAKAAPSSAKEETPAAASPSGSALSIRWDLLRDTLPVLLAGARMTLLLTGLTLLLGMPGGLLIALARLSGFAPLKLLATAFVEVVRGTPLLMQIYVIYFVLPAAGLSLGPFVASVAALSLNASAYISEIFRAGIESIDTGQREAARALGMTGSAAMRWVILPQTVRRVLPPLTNEAVALLKDSSLVSVVALAELMRVGKEVATNSGSPTTIYLAVALLYLLMTLPLTFLVRRLEQRWQWVSRRGGGLPRSLAGHNGGAG